MTGFISGTSKNGFLFTEGRHLSYSETTGVFYKMRSKMCGVIFWGVVPFILKSMTQTEGGDDNTIDYMDKTKAEVGQSSGCGFCNCI